MRIKAVRNGSLMMGAGIVLLLTTWLQTEEIMMAGGVLLSLFSVLAIYGGIILAISGFFTFLIGLFIKN